VVIQYRKANQHEKKEKVYCRRLSLVVAHTMADIADQHDQAAAANLDDSHAVGNGRATTPDISQLARGTKRPRTAAAEDDDDDDEKAGRERRKIEIKFISDKSRRHITFSKRKAGIMKKVRLLLPASFPMSRHVKNRLDSIYHLSRMFMPLGPSREPIARCLANFPSFAHCRRDFLADHFPSRSIRPTNFPSLLAPKFCCLSCPRLALFILSRRPNYSPLLPRQRERT
jgi:hypothetical protein